MCDLFIGKKEGFDMPELLLRKRRAFAFVSTTILAIMTIFSVPQAFCQQDEVPKGPPPVPVRVAKVEKKAVSDRIELVGTAQPATVSTVASEVSGVVEFFPIDEGDFVEKGQILASLSGHRLKFDLKAAVATREKIKANLAEARKQLDRMERLKRTQSVAEKSYDEAFYRNKALLQDLAKSEAEIELLNYDISRKKIVAPFSGFVSKEYTQIGEWVSGGGPVAELMDIGRIEAKVDVPERYSVNLLEGKKVSVLFASLSNRPREGVIDTVLPVGDPKARTFPVKISLENPDFRIKSGMEAQVVFTMGGTMESLVMPKDAVVISGKDRLVYKVENDIATPEPVVILTYFENFVSFEGALQPGDLVVIRGNERLRPGQPVKVVAP